MKRKIILIGNGESRLGIDFNSMADYKIGCNAVYRDFDVDCIVAVDRRVTLELIENNFKKIIYTREDWILPYPNFRILPDLPYKGNAKVDDAWNWGTGPHACNVAALMNPEEVHMYGFDLWGVENKINNVYKDTKNYDPSARSPIDPRFWIYQLAKCFELYPNVKWIQHQPSGWKKPESWDFNNLSIQL